MTRARALEAGCYAAAALLLVATAALRLSDTQDSRTRHAAEAGLDALQAAERSHLAAHQRFARFGPSAAELAAALPGTTLPNADDFAFDGLPDAAGVLHLRAITRPDAVADGRVSPMVVARDLRGPAPVTP